MDQAGWLPIIKRKWGAWLREEIMKIFILDRWTQTVMRSLKSESYDMKMLIEMISTPLKRSLLLSLSSHHLLRTQLRFSIRISWSEKEISSWRFRILHRMSFSPGSEGSWVLNNATGFRKMKDISCYFLIRETAEVIMDRNPLAQGFMDRSVCGTHG